MTIITFFIHSKVPEFRRRYILTFLPESARKKGSEYPFVKHFVSRGNVGKLKDALKQFYGEFGWTEVTLQKKILDIDQAAGKTIKDLLKITPAVQQELDALIRLNNLDHVQATMLASEARLCRVKVEIAAVNSANDDTDLKDAVWKYAHLWKEQKKITKATGQQQKRLNDFTRWLGTAGKAPYSQDVIDHATRELFAVQKRTRDLYSKSGNTVCFTYDISQDEELPNTVELHFNNAVAPKSPFEGEELEKRKAELRAIASDIRRNHPEIRHFFGTSWILSHKRFKSLMPPQLYEKGLTKTKSTRYGLSFWGQFYTKEGTLKEKQLEKLWETGDFPTPRLEGICDIKHFLDMYPEK